MAINNQMNKSYDVGAHWIYLTSAKNHIQEEIDFVPEIAITLGSGLSGLVNHMEVIAEIPYCDIVGFPDVTNKEHKGSFVFGNLCGKKVVCLNGRLHYYEGHSMWDVVAPIRICKLLGAKSAFLSAASGALNPNYHVGDFVAHSSCISLFVPSPMIGPNMEQLGDRFFDMTNIFDSEFLSVAKDVAAQNNIPLHTGVHVQTSGPQYETSADVKVLQRLGADTVSMSTVCEEIAARHMGMRIMGLSIISNMAAGISDMELSDDDVIETSKTYGENFITLVKGIVENIK